MYLLHHSQKISVRRTLKRLSSFTLVELLVVIGIIALLASVLLAVSGTAIKAAKRTRAFNTANLIQTGTLAYYTEYSVYPVPYGTPAGDYWVDDLSGSASKWGNLICVLCGNIHPSSPTTPFTPTTLTNARGVAFLSLKASDIDANDAPLNPLSTTTNLYFNIAMDADYDGLLGTTGVTSGKLPNFSTSTSSTSGSGMIYTGSSTAGVAVWENCNGTTSNDNPAFWVHTY
jgi:type II secretory pathway pseudopilin PulG